MIVRYPREVSRNLYTNVSVLSLNAPFISARIRLSGKRACCRVYASVAVHFSSVSRRMSTFYRAEVFHYVIPYNEFESGLLPGHPVYLHRLLPWYWQDAAGSAGPTPVQLFFSSSVESCFRCLKTCDRRRIDALFQEKRYIL